MQHEHPRSELPMQQSKPGKLPMHPASRTAHLSASNWSRGSEMPFLPGSFWPSCTTAKNLAKQHWGMRGAKGSALQAAHQGSPGPAQPLPSSCSPTTHPTATRMWGQSNAQVLHPRTFS